MRYLRLTVLVFILLSPGWLISSCKSSMDSSDFNLFQVYNINFEKSTALSPYHEPHIYAVLFEQNHDTLVLQDSDILYYGDANEDGIIDMGDTVLVERIILGLQLSTDGADADGNGDVNMGDVVIIERIILGLIIPNPIIPPTPAVKSITITDADLPAPPAGMKFHFVIPETEDPGPGKIRVSYSFYTYPVYFGVDNNQLWVSNLPTRDSLPASLVSYYDSLGIDEYTLYDEETGRYWFDDIPPWIDISEYDPSLTGIPVLVSASSTEGQAQFSYLSVP